MPPTTSTSSQHQRYRRELRELVRRIVPASQCQNGVPGDDEALFEFAEEMMGGGSSSGPRRIRKEELGLVAEEARRYLAAVPSPTSSAPQILTSLASRLSSQPHPRDKGAALRFLLAMSPPLPTSARSGVRTRRGLSVVGSDISEGNATSGRGQAGGAAEESKGRARVMQPTPVQFPSAGEEGGAEAGSQGMSMATRLRAHRARKGSNHVAEVLLLRDILYILQGIDGTFVRFRPDSAAESDDGNPDDSLGGGGIIFAEDAPEGKISQKQRDLLMKLAELGHLYREVAKACSEEDANERGVVEQSLVYALKGELTEYYRLLALIETQLGPEPPSGTTLPTSDLTLKRLLLFLSPAMLRLRLSNALANSTLFASPPLRGGALISLLHSYTSHGDPFVHTFTRGLLEDVSKPLFVIMSRWIWEGELADPSEEFFVQLNPEMSGVGWGKSAGGGGTRGVLGDGEEEEEGVSGWKIWSRKFGFRREMLPAFISESFGRKIFSTGKSLNFIKHSCGDTDWVVASSIEAPSPGKGKELHYSDLAGLERSIVLAYSAASQRLFDIFFSKFRLLDHLLALKDYMLLCKGDFVSLLMEHLGPSLNRPANTLYRHNLTATLETAVRGSSSVNDRPDILRRLDARVLEFTHGEVGWKAFTLEYKVDAPLDTVLTPTAMERYVRCFRWLWGVKRVEWALAETWRNYSTGARTVLKLASLQYDFHQVRIILSEMLHFVRQLDSYAHLEVIECSWQELEKVVLNRKEVDLDGLIEAHDSYLTRLVGKCLLLGTSRGREDATLVKVEEALKIVLAFKEVADSLYSYALSEMVRDDGSAQGTPRSDAIGSPRFPPPNPAALDDIRRRLAEYTGGFTGIIQDVITALGGGKDMDMRFLAVRLNFSLQYKVGGKR